MILEGRKTLYFNFFFGVIGIILTQSEYLYAGIALLFMAIGNIVLRIITKTPVWWLR